MKILQVSYTDAVGRRFNGQDLHQEFLKRGHSSKHCVWDKNSNDNETWQLSDISARDSIYRFVTRVERRLSVQSLFPPFSWQFLFDKRFLTADLVHYHLIHTGYFSLLSLPLLTKMKPSVWTLHDPWAITGRCVHPFDCERWKIGCGNCPNLDSMFSLREDRTALLWKIKKIIYQKSNIDIILASKYMLNLAKQSPLLSKFRLHHIPFGIDLSYFKPGNTERAKQELGVKEGSLALTLRAIDSEFKGLEYVKRCLYNLKVDKPICIMTFNVKGLLDEFKDKFQIIELGWVDNEKLIRAYNASDIFLMPSMAESFGMMAIEAMACGKPVISFEGTALPEVTFSPQGGISVPSGDADALTAAVQTLIDNQERRMDLGQNARKIAKANYDFKLHVNRVLELYREVIRRRKADKDG